MSRLEADLVFCLLQKTRLRSSGSLMHLDALLRLILLRELFTSLMFSGVYFEVLDCAALIIWNQLISLQGMLWLERRVEICPVHDKRKFNNPDRGITTSASKASSRPYCRAHLKISIGPLLILTRCAAYQYLFSFSFVCRACGN